MSASLVGSEMCIRDSCPPRGRKEAWQRLFLSRPWHALGLSWARGDGTAVSYTHLTLPTICSV
eukprot:5680493-Alexandrium_andersonii.AAC.1